MCVLLGVVGDSVLTFSPSAALPLLCSAARLGRIAALEALIKQGANMFVRNVDHMTVLDVAGLFEGDRLDENRDAVRKVCVCGVRSTKSSLVVPDTRVLGFCFCCA